MLLFVLTVAAAVGSGLMAGLFGAFSTFLMRALAEIPRPMGAVAMRRINVVIIRPSFLLVFMGTAVVSAAALVVGWDDLGASRTAALVGAGAYIVGCLLVTVARNVPLNDRLEAVDPEGSDADAMWDLYLSDWVRWNHVRSLATLIATIAWILAAAAIH